MVITQRKKYSVLPLFLNGAHIEIMTKFKSFEITIDRNLTFKAHIRQLKRAYTERFNVMKI